MDPLRPLQSKEAILLRSKALLSRLAASAKQQVCDQARKLALMQKYVEAVVLAMLGRCIVTARQQSCRPRLRGLRRTLRMKIDAFVSGPANPIHGRDGTPQSSHLVGRTGSAANAITCQDWLAAAGKRERERRVVAGFSSHASFAGKTARNQASASDSASVSSLPKLFGELRGHVTGSKRSCKIRSLLML